MNALTYLGIPQRQALDLITDLETITEALADAIAGKDYNPSSEQKMNTIIRFQSTAAQLKNIAANIRKQ